MTDSLFDISKTYPGVKGRKLKKELRKIMTYDLLGYQPASANKRKNSHRLSPRRGDRVITSDGKHGTFVGVDPTGKVWCALDEYKIQFPFNLQCRIFDLSWRSNVHSS